MPSAADSPPTVVLLHGAGDTPLSWAMVCAELVGTFAVVVPGRTGTDPESLTLAGRLRTLTAALTDLPGPLVLVGHSFGGLLARAWAGEQPERVSGLVLLDPTPPQAGELRAVSAGMHASAAVLDLMRLLAPTGVPTLLLRTGLHPLYPEHRAAARAMPPSARHAWRHAVADAARGGGAQELRAVPSIAREAREVLTPPEVQSIVLASNAYGPTWIEWQQTTADELSAELWRTGDRSHNIHLRHPDLVARAVRVVAPPPASAAYPPASTGACGATVESRSSARTTRGNGRYPRVDVVDGIAMRPPQQARIRTKMAAPGPYAIAV
ncbi:alpha/beta fold hydrolase [Cellulomonas sp. P24]|uniref:alpha/beta fold hydrolase n=1 Tax=Cellulomonas sp. P24 TaxID=2885206 RepID=UPI00216AF67E|nr:alpha/beta hydrolase [Cellulomonas sp. P24]MCR6491124.1 alpha/beta hydrolase [Cellulomonas sp. P24]